MLQIFHVIPECYGPFSTFFLTSASDCIGQLKTTSYKDAVINSISNAEMLTF